MDKPQIVYSGYTYVHPLIRWRWSHYADPYDGGQCTDYEIEVFRRPYFWGRVGAKRWEPLIAANSFKVAFGFAQDYMKRELAAYDAKNPPVDIFEPTYMKLLGYTVTEDNGQYGKAISDAPIKGKRVLSWNRDGAMIHFGIREDADTRNAFNGTVENREQLQLLLRLAK
jgi:hypothetical protein